MNNMIRRLCVCKNPTCTKMSRAFMLAGDIRQTGWYAVPKKQIKSICLAMLKNKSRNLILQALLRKDYDSRKMPFSICIAYHHFHPCFLQKDNKGLHLTCQLKSIAHFMKKNSPLVVKHSKLIDTEYYIEHCVFCLQKESISSFTK